MHKSAEKRGRKYCSLACNRAAKRALIYDDERQLKKCSRCSEWKPFSSYAPARGSKNGAHSLQSTCTPCANILSREWSKKNAERRKELNDLSRERTKGKKKVLTPEQRERKNALAREWRKKNRHKVLMWNKRRLHRQRAAGEMPDSIELLRMRCMQDARCTYCGDLLPENAHLDHKKPVLHGGTNDGANLQWLCGPCNLKKGTQTHEEYAGKVGTYQLPPSPLPNWFDAEAFGAAMERGNYAEARALLCK